MINYIACYFQFANCDLLPVICYLWFAICDLLYVIWVNSIFGSVKRAGNFPVKARHRVREKDRQNTGKRPVRLTEPKILFTVICYMRFAIFEASLNCQIEHSTIRQETDDSPSSSKSKHKYHWVVRIEKIQTGWHSHLNWFWWEIVKRASELS